MLLVVLGFAVAARAGACRPWRLPLRAQGGVAAGACARRINCKDSDFFGVSVNNAIKIVCKHRLGLALCRRAGLVAASGRRLPATCRRGDWWIAGVVSYLYKSGMAECPLPFGLLKRPVLGPETGRFALPNGLFGNAKRHCS